MLMEGTGKYFWMLFLVFLIVYVTVKISLGYLLKRAKEKSWKAYVPIYTNYVLVNLLEMPKKIFYLSLIPFAGLYYLYLIIKQLLIGFGENPNEAIWYVIFPMYNFPKLVFKKPKFAVNEYDLTEEFLETQNILFEKPKVEEDLIVTEVPVVSEVSSDSAISSQNNFENFNTIKPVNNATEGDSVFNNEALEPDKTHTTYVEVKPEENKEEKPIITPVVNGRPKMCPKCGARLSSEATTCFLCGTKL